MDDEQRKLNAGYLKSMATSPGGVILLKHIEDEIVDGWEKFIALPCDQKTSKAAITHQARYIVLKDLKEWLVSEIKLGE